MPNDKQPPITRALAAERLAPVTAKRGYLLPHHGLMAVAAPDLLRGYEAAYQAMTLDRRALSDFDKEFIWMAILVVSDEPLGTHHLEKFRAAGGTDHQYETAVRLAGHAFALRAFRFTGDNWADLVPALGNEAAYRGALDALLADRGIDPVLAELTMLSVHTCLRQHDAVAWHFDGLYRHGADERAIADTLALTMWNGSVPNFIYACGIWRRMILDGQVDASDAFRTWAEIPAEDLG